MLARNIFYLTFLPFKEKYKYKKSSMRYWVKSIRNNPKCPMDQEEKSNYL
jgi:hypothetical protein